MLLFQSYLYGIEIPVTLSRFNIYNTSFNRTFMELKSGKPVGERRSCFTFQSYLYGIEILGCYYQDFATLVSIVPLWN